MLKASWKVLILELMSSGMTVMIINNKLCLPYLIIIFCCLTTLFLLTWPVNRKPKKNPKYELILLASYCHPQKIKNSYESRDKVNWLQSFRVLVTYHVQSKSQDVSNVFYQKRIFSRDSNLKNSSVSQLVSLSVCLLPLCLNSSISPLYLSL